MDLIYWWLLICSFYCCASNRGWTRVKRLHSLKLENCEDFLRAITDPKSRMPHNVHRKWLCFQFILNYILRIDILSQLMWKARCMLYFLQENRTLKHHIFSQLYPKETDHLSLLLSPEKDCWWVLKRTVAEFWKGLLVSPEKDRWWVLRRTVGESREKDCPCVFT